MIKTHLEKNLLIVTIQWGMCECRVVVVGDKGVGKSALIRRFTTGVFTEVR